MTLHKVTWLGRHGSISGGTSFARLAPNSDHAYFFEACPEAATRWVVLCTHAAGCLASNGLGSVLALILDAAGGLRVVVMGISRLHAFEVSLHLPRCVLRTHIVGLGNRMDRRRFLRATTRERDTLAVLLASALCGP